MMVASPHSNGARRRLSLLFDFDGTLSVSLYRRYAVALRAFEALMGFRIRERELFCIGAPDLGSFPSEAEFLHRYPQVEDVSFLLPFRQDTSEGRRLAHWFNHKFSEVLQFYLPEHLACDYIPEGYIAAVRALRMFGERSLVSFRVQSPAEAMAQLAQLGYVAHDMFKPRDINIVGQKGADPFRAKFDFISRWYAQIFEDDKSLGGTPLFFGDSIADLRVAWTLGIGFVGLTNGGECSEERFREFIELEADRQQHPLRYWLFPDIRHPGILDLVKTEAGKLGCCCECKSDVDFCVRRPPLEAREAIAAGVSQ